MALSLAAHVSLAYAWALKGGGASETAPDSPIPTRAFAIEFIKPETAESDSGEMLSSHENLQENLQAALPERASGIGTGPGDRLFNLAPLKPHYFQIDELTEKPLVVRDISPVLSLGLADAMSQNVVLRLLINERGEVDQVQVESDNLALPVQDLVKDAFGKLRFESGKIDNIPVKTQLMIEVNLEATGAQ